ncbi:MAG: mannose-1-phosphate guanylyltransferase/mannose-6-phosphate isomerase [Alphaproteobacteria bacterium]|nr:mannose-1-phosphate guanylyltransferase/mannose-6-phosphate isomerase [Alphaproteobacteria bacterium]
MPVVLSGGTGDRLWPLSGEEVAKPFLRLGSSHRTMFQDAVVRVQDTELFSSPLVVGHCDQKNLIEENLQEVRVGLSMILLEPEGRNTAAPVTIAALWAQARGMDYILVMPSDTMVGDEAVFRDDAASALRVCQDTQEIVYFGIPPERPHTGYGYISCDGPANENGGRRVQVFHEKPNEDEAGDLIAAGALWNSGMFMIPVRGYLEDLQGIDPALLHLAERALQGGHEEGRFCSLSLEPYQEFADIAFDKAYCEKTSKGRVLAARFGWQDLGSWDSVYDNAPKDDAGNVLSGPVCTHKTSGCLVRSDRALVATVGVEDLIVVAVKDAILVVRKDQAQEVKALVEKLKAEGYLKGDEAEIFDRIAE